jgi:Eco57I restriction-modification methylase
VPGDRLQERTAIKLWVDFIDALRQDRLVTPDRYKPLLDRDFLKSQLDYEYRDYLAANADGPLRERLEGWAKRELKKETQAEAAFVQRFFVDTWGYRPDGIGADSFQLWPQFPIAGAGQGGNQGKADLGVGEFGGNRSEIPQLVCEFKDIRSGLDAKQNRKGNDRSPVTQAKDYLWGARRGLFPNAQIQPRFAIVTDMDEFRLYWWDGFPDRYLRFRITPGDLFHQTTLLGNDEEARFDRFLFQRLFRADMLLSDAGRTRFERLIEKQGKAARRLEGEFYGHYRRYREVLINNILPFRPAGVTRSGAVRLAQKLLDRLIFTMFAEDMGLRVGFPPNALVEQLERYSKDQFLEDEGHEVWDRLKLIFQRMDTGGDLGGTVIEKFNGGLFADDPDLNALRLPNRLFVRRGQAWNEARTAEHKDTLYYLAVTYNFAREGDAENSIGLYTLGHIFEQSIVELEALEAKAEDRLSLTEITKRKRDGVYYTPEWAVQRIVEETVDPLFASWRSGAGWAGDVQPDAKAALAYWQRLKSIRILDPACGSGAFLIVALRHLEAEFARAIAACREAGALAQNIEPDAITEMILTDNLWGVDINPASVEITKLSLWLHTAQPKRPLSGLDRTIQCGNSLVDNSFYAKRMLDDAEERDRINTFDWTGDFASGSFDAVIGNPPYVKLQNFVKVNADQAAWLASEASGYVSTRTGNFDLYLPFIEKGLALLNDGGRMGYIAPSLWPTLDYGEGLRGLIHAGRNLEKWLDFRSWQVFEEATVYTAIQIFSKAPADAIALSFAGDGDISRTDWGAADYSLPYAAIAAPLQPWLLAPAPVKALIERLGREGTRLDAAENTKGIIVGIQTSADHIYHLRRLAKNRYAYRPLERREKGGKVVTVKGDPVEVAIEDAIMKPLVSGKDVKRFLEPRTDIYLLFPYHVDGDGARLRTPEEMAAQFPRAWAYLRGFEAELRQREKNAFDDDGWYRMGRNQNLDKQEIPKLMIAQLVPELRASFDDGGHYYVNNVRVNGILPRAGNGWYLLGAMNAPLTNYVFKWLGKPKDNGFYEANKQFIAPLPIPNASAADRAGLSAIAQGLQQRRTAQLDDRAALDERLGACARTNWTLDRILPGVRPLAEIEATMPKSVKPADRKGWIDDERSGDEEAAIARLDALVRPDSEFAVVRADGKLGFLIDEVESARVFVGAEGELVEAQWRAVAVGFAITGKDDGKRLSDRLRRVATEARPEIAAQIIDYGRRLADRDVVLRDDERQLHELTCAMFKLTPAERALVDAGR